MHDVIVFKTGQPAQEIRPYRETSLVFHLLLPTYTLSYRNRETTLLVKSKISFQVRCKRICLTIDASFVNLYERGLCIHLHNTNWQHWYTSLPKQYPKSKWRFMPPKIAACRKLAKYSLKPPITAEITNFDPRYRFTVGDEVCLLFDALNPGETCSTDSGNRC